MTTKDEALRMALEALEMAENYVLSEPILMQEYHFRHPTRMKIEHKWMSDKDKLRKAANKIRSALAEQPAQQQVSAVLDVTIEGDAAKLLAAMLEPMDGEPTPIRLLVGNGHSGHGLYVAAAEYQEEGAVLVMPIEQPAHQHDYRIKYDRPCYKCRSNFCPGNCKEPEHLQNVSPTMLVHDMPAEHEALRIVLEEWASDIESGRQVWIPASTLRAAARALDEHVEPNWDYILKQVETATGIPVEPNNYSIIIREVRRWLQRQRKNRSNDETFS